VAPVTRLVGPVTSKMVESIFYDPRAADYDETVTMRSHLSGAAIACAFAVLLALVAGVHLARLDEVPRGLFVDESSIGLNAATVAESGEDEHGVSFPVFFRAFGEYKNPLYIYTAAGIFRLAGVSVWALRLTSFLFFALLLGGVACLVRRLFPGSRATMLYALAAAGCLPWFFTVSRIAFEAISQPAVVIWMLCLCYAVYETELPRPWLAFACGLLIGLSFYTYSTARLLTPCFAAALLAAYASRRFWCRHAAVLAGAGLALIPYVVFSLQHPGALTHRFRRLTYLFDESLTPGRKIATFFASYAIYWSPRYLLVEGDFNRRNSTGHAGELYLVVFALALLGAAGLARRGAAGIARRGAAGKGRFVALLAANLVMAPVAAALTSGTSALRSLLVGLYLVVFSCFGFALLAGTSNVARRRAALAAVALALAFESGRYLTDYFGPYVEESVWAFKSWDFRGVLITALAQRPSRIEVAQQANQPYAHLEFYRRTLPHPPPIPMEMAAARWPSAAPGLCLIYFNPEAAFPDEDLYPSRVWGLEDPTILRCFLTPARPATPASAAPATPWPTTARRH
jgi:4-amino-4-deoxy-L-arabinose transferase-like glycosyltransferase